jgi:hypothetical protein
MHGVDCSCGKTTIVALRLTDILQLIIDNKLSIKLKPWQKFKKKGDLFCLWGNGVIWDKEMLTKFTTELIVCWNCLKKDRTFDAKGHVLNILYCSKDEDDDTRIHEDYMTDETVEAESVFKRERQPRHYHPSLLLPAKCSSADAKFLIPLLLKIINDRREMAKVKARAKAKVAKAESRKGQLCESDDPLTESEVEDSQILLKQALELVNDSDCYVSINLNSVKSIDKEKKGENLHDKHLIFLFEKDGIVYFYKPSEREPEAKVRKRSRLFVTGLDGNPILDIKFDGASEISKLQPFIDTLDGKAACFTFPLCRPTTREAAGLLEASSQVHVAKFGIGLEVLGAYHPGNKTSAIYSVACVTIFFNMNRNVENGNIKFCSDMMPNLKQRIMAKNPFAKEDVFWGPEATNAKERKAQKQVEHRAKKRKSKPPPLSENKQSNIKDSP